MLSDARALPPVKASKVLDQLRERVRHLHDSLRTQRARVYWVRHHIGFSGAGYLTRTDDLPLTRRLLYQLS